MDENTPEFTEPANLKLLRRLVTVLLITMIVGFVILISIFAMRLTGNGTDLNVESVSLPAGATATGYSKGTDWIAVTTDQDEILIFNRDGSLRQTIKVESEN